MAILTGTTTFGVASGVVSNSIPIPLPGVEGDYVEIQVAANGGTGVVVPSGWTQLARSTSTVTNPRFAAFAKFLTAADVGITLTVSIGSTAVTWNWTATPRSGVDTVCSNHPNLVAPHPGLLRIRCHQRPNRRLHYLELSAAVWLMSLTGRRGCVGDTFSGVCR